MPDPRGAHTLDKMFPDHKNQIYVNCGGVPSPWTPLKTFVYLFWGHASDVRELQFTFIKTIVSVCPAHEPHWQNPVYIYFSHVPIISEPQFGFVKTTVLVCPAHEPHWQNLVYLFCGRVPDIGEPKLAFFKTTVLVCPANEPHWQNLVYLFFWSCAWHWGAPICICQNHCACVPSPWAPLTKSGISILWSRAWHWVAPIYICQNHCAHVPNP